MRTAADRTRAASGAVRMVLVDGSRAVVALDDGGMATLNRDSLLPLVPLDRVVEAGMVVHGTLDEETQELRIAVPSVPPTVLEQAFPTGCVTLALVTKVTPTGATLALHPEHTALVSRSDVSSNPRDRIDDLLVEGETVVVRVLRHHDSTIRFRMHDVDDDEPIVPPMRLLPGGPEWLSMPVAEPDEALALEDDLPPRAPSEAPVGIDAHPAGRGALRSTQLALEAARAEIRRLQAELADAQTTSPAEQATVQGLLEKRAELVSQVTRLKQANAELRKQVKVVQRTAASGGPRSRRAWFADDESWLRNEIHLAWLERLPATDRVTWQLPDDYRIGPRLAESVLDLPGAQLDKALKAIVDVLVGRAREIAGRQVHALRVDDSAGSPDLVREDGARCMRCAIENDTASARRLHYWLLPGGRVELCRVVLHDDTAP